MEKAKNKKIKKKISLRKIKRILKWPKKNSFKVLKRVVPIGISLIMLAALIFSGTSDVKAASYSGKYLRTIEYVMGGGSDNTSRTSATLVYAGASWNTTKATAGTITVAIPGSGIKVKQAYLDVYAQVATAATVSAYSATIDVSNGPAAGTSINIGQKNASTIQNTSGLSDHIRILSDVTSFFQTQTTAQFNSGVTAVSSVSLTGPTRRLTTAKLVITFEQDYSTSTHSDIKTVRFPLNSRDNSDTGTKTAQLAATTTVGFDYNANIPDCTADADVESVWFEMSAEVDSVTASTMEVEVSGGTDGPDYAWGEVLTDDNNINICYQPPVGGSDFLRNTAQICNVTSGTVPLNIVGGELVVTYQFSTGAVSQTETTSYYMDQRTSTPGGTKNTFSQAINISNGSFAVSNLWFKVNCAPIAADTIGVYGTVGGAVEASNTYTYSGANPRTGQNATIYYDMSADKTSFSSSPTTIAGAVQFNSSNGSPPAVELFVTFTWAGSSGGTVTKSVTYAAPSTGVDGITNGAKCQAAYLTIPETITKTYRSPYLRVSVDHSNATSITAGTATMRVNDGTTAVPERADAVSESFRWTMLHSVSSSTFGGSNFSWTERTFQVNAYLNQGNYSSFAIEFVVTYDAALGEDNPAASTAVKQTKTVEYILGGGTDNASRTSNTVVYAGSSWNTTKGSAGTVTVAIPGSNIKVRQAYVDMAATLSTSAGIIFTAVTLDVSNGPAAGTSVDVGDKNSGSIYATTGLSSSHRQLGDATAFFQTQTSAQFNSGVTVVGSANIYGPSRSLTNLKLVITYESDYSTVTHNEIKTVRFPLNSRDNSDTGTKTAQLAALGTVGFDYTADIPDCAADGDVKSAWFEVSAEVDSTTASTIQTTIKGGTAGPAYNWQEALLDDNNVNVCYQPPVGGSDLKRSTAQVLNVVAGSVPLNLVGGELVVTYQYSTGASSQTETTSYYMDQRTSAPTNTKNTFSQAINISNTGFSVKNLWFKINTAPIAAVTFTVYGTVGAAAEANNAYTYSGVNPRTGQDATIIYDMSADKASFSGSPTTIAGATQFSVTATGSPPAVQLFTTFTWSGNRGGTITKTVKYGAPFQGDDTVNGGTRNRPVYMYLPESVTKTYRSAYLNYDVMHSYAATAITAGTATARVFTGTTSVPEQADAVSEAFRWQMLHNVSSTLFGGSTIAWTDKVLEVTFSLGATNYINQAADLCITYDAAFAERYKVSGSAKQYDQSSNVSDSEVVKVAVNGSIQAETGVTDTGAFEIAGLSQPSADDVVTVWIDGVADANEANAVFKYDGSGNTGSVLLYEEHLTLGSDDTGQTITNTNLSSYDNSASGGNEDIFFDVDDITNDLDVDDLSQSSQEELYIGNSGLVYRPDSGSSGDINTHDIEINGTLTADGNTINIEGSWDNNYIFTCNTGMVNFNATSGTETINSTGATTATFNDVYVGPLVASTATWNLGSALDINGALEVRAGTLAMNGANNINLAEGFVVDSGAAYDDGSGTLTFDGDNATPYTWSDANSPASNMGTVVIDGSSVTVNLGSSVTATKLTVGANDTFGLASSGYTFTITGSGANGSRPFIVDGTLNEGTSSIVVYESSAATNVEDETYCSLKLSALDATPFTYTIGTAGSQTLAIVRDFMVGNDSSGTAVTVTCATYDPIVDVNRNFQINSGNTFVAPQSSSFTLGSIYHNNGTFTANSGKVIFDASTTGKTIDTGSSDFYDVEFNNAGGGWTIQNENFTCVRNLAITSINDLTVNSVTVTVQGTYSIGNTVPGGTTWTSATLLLDSDTSYTVGSSAQSAETYDTLQIGSDTDIRVWNSSAGTTTVDSAGSLYSQDHSATDGDLYIWGDCHSLTNDYWSYATDFDGTDLSGGSERQVDVRVDPAGSFTVDSGDKLAAIGDSSNRTTVDKQGLSAAGFGLVCAGGRIDFQYTDFDSVDGNKGLDIQTGSTVDSLDDTTFDNLVGTGGSDDALITVASTVIGSANKTITGVDFSNSLSSAEFNVNRTGSDDTGYWDFDATTGDFDSENNDGKNGANEDDPGMLRWDDSTGSNQPPEDPTDLAQKKTDDTVLAVGDWTNENSVKFTATAEDLDNPDTLYLEVEAKDINTAFDGTGTNTGSGVAYSGTPVTVTVTITGLTDATEYHWRARVVDQASDTSNWVAYGSNSEGPPADRDFGTDTTAPTGGTVYDGAAGDQDWNDGSLNTLEANWTSFNCNVSGLKRYEYALRRKPDNYYWDSANTVWESDANWYNAATNTSYSINPVYLQTGVIYYASVRAVDNANNTGTAVDSNGQQVLPTLSFSLTGTSITFANLNNLNNWTDTQTHATTMTTSTNASAGYTVKAYTTQLMTSLAYPTKTIADFAGTWADPILWPLGLYGFGYTSSDTSVQGSNRFNNETEYAGFDSSHAAPGDIVCDHTAAVNGQTGAISNEVFYITYKVAVSVNQTSSSYRTYGVYVCTANY